MAAIPFTVENATKCVCPTCPVETPSQCIKPKLSVLKEALKQTPLVPEAIPGLYCSSGKAACQDFNYKKACICFSCPVYVQNKLKSGKPVLYFCRDGASK